MIHAFSLEDIRNRTRLYDEPTKAVGILLARPSVEIVKNEILPDINYFYHRSGRYIDFFLPGYGAYWYGNYPDEVNVCKVAGVNWSYSDLMFCKFIAELESVSKWRYNGETELIIIDSQRGTLNFSNTLSIWIEAAITDRAIISVRNFFESLIRISRSMIETSEIGNVHLVKSASSSIIENIIDKLPFNVGTTLLRTKYFVRRNLAIE